MQNIHDLYKDMPLSAQAMHIAAYTKTQHAQPILWIVPNNYHATALVQELIHYRGSEKGIVHFADWETLPYDRFQPHPSITAQRLSALYQAATEKIAVMITNASTLLYKTPTPTWILQNIWDSGNNNTRSRHAWLMQLQTLYDRVNTLDQEGQYCIRGSDIDIYPIGHAPCRLVFLDDTLESITLLDRATFEPQERIQRLHIMPRFEATSPNTTDTWQHALSTDDPRLIRRLREGDIIPGYQYYLPCYHASLVPLTSHLPTNTLLLIDTPTQKTLHEHWALIEHRYHTHTPYSVLPRDSIAVDPSYFLHSLPHYSTHNEYIKLTDIPDMTVLQAAKTIICTKNSARTSLLESYFRQRHISYMTLNTHTPLTSLKAGIYIALQPLLNNLHKPRHQTYWIKEEDLIKKQLTLQTSPQETSSPLPEVHTPWEQYTVGQKVSHRDLGIGILEDVVHLEEHAHIEAFFKIRYAQNKIVYVPIDNLGKIAPYYGNAEITDPGNKRWSQRVSKAREACEQFASRMLHDHAVRLTQSADKIHPSSDYQTFLSQFYYEDTPDQTRATNDILADIIRGTPMDRLLLGDVGFGKTEVMLRLAFVAIMAHHQVLILCPTTILTEQHYQTALERFSQWPIRIGILSRLKKPKACQETLQAFVEGSIDLLISTHSILSLQKPIKNLGVVIIDEEHRFGVGAKEKILSMHPHVHRLSVSATPIPRTLQSAMHHVKDMSFIQHPPKMRRAVQTIVTPYDDSIIHDAIVRETARGGQVFFIHNDIASQEARARNLQEAFPLLSIAVVHGQMPENVLESIMHDFSQGQHHILISTTLIESGIDIPNANTIIIHRSDTLGLAQLHQLRGRVGRSNHQAYAYLLYPEALQDNDAKKRLDALKEHTGLGAGWMLAIKDLEIRGAGSFLGKEQSGHVDDIGYGLYQQLLHEALEQLQPNNLPHNPDSTIDLQLERYLPESYIPTITARMNVYSAIHNTRSMTDLERVWRSLIDRYGPCPESAHQLLAHHHFVILTRGSGLLSIIKNNNRIIWTWSDNAQINTALLFQWASEKKFDIQFQKSLSFSINSEHVTMDVLIDIFIALTQKDTPPSTSTHTVS